MSSRTSTDLLHEHGQGHQSGALRGSLSSGVRWIGSARVGTQVIQIAVTLILTRILDPSDFGLMAVANVVVMFFDRVLGDTGTSVALVQRERITHGLASTVLFLNIIVGAVVTLVLVTAAPLLARVMGDADATSLLRVVGLIAIVKSASYVPLSLLRRWLSFRKLAVLLLVQSVTTAVATVGMAMAGFGVWSLAIGAVVGAATILITSWTATSWRPLLTFDRKQLTTISGFSGHLTVQNLFAYFILAGDRFVVSRFIGREALGFYDVSSRVIRYPLATVAQTYGEVVLPNLAKLQHDNASMLNAYRRTVAGTTYLMFPVCFLLAALSEPLVDVALGAKWEPATRLIAILALMGGIQTISATTGSVYLAKGRSDLSLIWTIVSGSILFGLYCLGSIWGAEGVAWAFLGGITVLTYPALWLSMRLLDARPRDILSVTLGPLTASVLAGATAFGVAQLIGSDLAKLVIGGIAGALVYLAYSMVAQPSGFVDARSMVADAFKRESSSPDD